MEETQESKPRNNPEQGAMIGLAVVVIFAVLFATAGAARKIAPEAPGTWDRFFDIQNGVAFEFRKPRELRMKPVPLVQQRYDDSGTLQPGRTRWYEVYRENVKVGSLEVLVPPPEVLTSHALPADQVFSFSDDGRIAFRFRPMVPHDGESLDLFERILDTVRNQGAD